MWTYRISIQFSNHDVNEKVHSSNNKHHDLRFNTGVLVCPTLCQTHCLNAPSSGYGPPKNVTEIYSSGPHGNSESSLYLQMAFPAMSAMFDESGEYLFLTGSKDDEPHEPMNHGANCWFPLAIQLITSKKHSPNTQKSLGKSSNSLGIFHCHVWLWEATKNPQ